MASAGSAAQSCSLLESGDLLAGKYRIVRVIGEGGMGVVYEARHEKLGSRVAIKVLREAERKVDEFVRRFEREARAAARLKGVNVTRVHDVDVLDDGTPFMVMEFLDGVDLDAELVARGQLPIAEAVDYLLQACSGVAEAHSLGIVHRDIKPHNLFLCGDAPRTVKLLDFGISKLCDEGESSVTLTRSSLGTPLYMSPEQIRSAKNADARADIWSLGVILYEALTGKPPFDGDGPSGVIAAITADEPEPPRAVRPELPQALSDAIMKALQKKPNARYASVEELAEAIAPFGSTGNWSPPPRGSNPSHHRISHADLRLQAEALTLPAQQVAITDLDIELDSLRPETRRRKTIPMVALLMSIATAATAAFILTSPRRVPAAAVAEDNAASTTPPLVVAPPSPIGSGLELSPGAPVTEPPAAPPASAGALPKPGRRPKATTLVRPKQRAPEPAPELPPAPPPPTENPLHL